VFAAFFIVDSVGDKLSAGEKQKLLDRMDSEDRGEVWGYMKRAPVDSDDTAFVIRTYRMLGRNVAADSLFRFYNETGGAFTTFDGRGGAALHYEPSVVNNFGIHPEVNANVFALLAGTGLSGSINENLIAQAQTSQGYWRSYFYPGKYYGTYMSLALLCATGKGTDAREKGIAFLTGSQNPDGSWGSPAGPYETSLALDALAACGIFGGPFEKGVSWLLKQQMPDGSFRDGKRVIWEYTHRESPPVIWRAFDTEGVVTTALAVKALRSAQRSEQ
jgi:hypothetical protein